MPVGVFSAGIDCKEVVATEGALVEDGRLEQGRRVRKTTRRLNIAVL